MESAIHVGIGECHHVLVLMTVVCVCVCVCVCEGGRV